jgi:ATP-dependent Clp protease ATP-binding subunit ClpA
MFERFTDDARQTVVHAQDEARRLHHGWIGTEHLLLGILDLPDSPTAAVLTAHGLSHESVSAAVVAFVGSDDLDAAALTTLGIDLAAVRSSAEAAFGPGALRPIGSTKPRRAQSGHIPFSGRAKKVLELSLREALALKSKTISDGHIALGLLREGEGLAAKVITDRGVDIATLSEEIRGALRSSA